MGVPGQRLTCLINITYLPTALPRPHVVGTNQGLAASYPVPQIFRTDRRLLTPLAVFQSLKLRTNINKIRAYGWRPAMVAEQKKLNFKVTIFCEVEYLKNGEWAKLLY